MVLRPESALVFTLLAGLSYTAVAQDLSPLLAASGQKAKANKEHDKLKEKKKNKTTEAARQQDLGVRHFLALRGGAVVNEFGFGVEYDFKAASDFLIGWVSLFGQSEITNIKTEGYDTSYSYADYGLHYFQARYFLWSSFYFNGGLGARTIANHLEFVKPTGEYFQVETRALAAFLGLGVGNQWLLDSGLTLGAEWFAVQLPLANSYSAEVSASPFDEQVQTTNLDRANEIARGNASKPSICVLLLSLGFAF